MVPPLPAGEARQPAQRRMEHQRAQYPRLSCHHGNAARENDLEEAVRVADAFPEIDVFEIDFLTHRRLLISAHDYSERVIRRGSRLSSWLRELVVKRGKTLWIDVKENLALYFHWCHEHFDAQLLFECLEEARAVDAAVVARVWVGCQDETLREALIEYNAVQCAGRWTIILDMPMAPAYVAQFFAPECLRGALQESVCEDFEHHQYERFDVISLDQSFFTSRKALKAFIRSLRLAPHVLVVLNSFARDQARSASTRRAL